MKKTLIVLLFTLVSTVLVLAATKEELEQQSRVGMTFDDLIKLYGQPSTSGKDRAYPDGFLRELDILGPGDGYEFREQQFREMKTTRFVNFSLPQLTITPFSLPLDRIRNKDFNKEQTVGIAVKPIQGVNLQLKDMGELFQFLTKCNKKLIRKSSIEQNPSIYYTQDKHYLVIFWYLDNHTSLKIIDLNLIHQATGTRSPEAIQDKPRIGMTFAELSGLYGAPNTGNTDRAFPKGYMRLISLINHDKGVEEEDRRFTKMVADRLKFFSLSRMTLVTFAAPSGEIKNPQYDKDQVIGIEAWNVKEQPFTREDTLDIFKALTKSTKSLILKSPAKMTPEIYYSSDKRYVVCMYFSGQQTTIKILDRKLAHKAMDVPAPNKRKPITDGL
jgi:hypothetical protein